MWASFNAGVNLCASNTFSRRLAVLVCFLVLTKLLWELVHRMLFTTLFAFQKGSNRSLCVK